MKDVDVFKQEINDAGKVCAAFAKEKGLSDAAYITHGGCYTSCGSSSVECVIAELIKEVRSLKWQVEKLSE